MAASFVSHNGVHCSSTILPNPSPNFTSPSYSNSAHPSKTSIHTSSVKPFLVPPTLLSLFPTLKVNNAQGTQHHLAPIPVIDSDVWYQWVWMHAPQWTMPHSSMWRHFIHTSRETAYLWLWGIPQVLLSSISGD